MITIYKYPFKITDSLEIRMPRHAEILHVGLQKGEPHLWARVDTTQPKVTRFINIRGTGHDASRVDRHIGTLIMSDGEFVFHVFDQGEQP